MDGIIKTDFKCMDRVLVSQNTFLRRMYRFNKRVLWGALLRVLRLCTLFMAAVSEHLSLLAVNGPPHLSLCASPDISPCNTNRFHLDSKYWPGTLKKPSAERTY